MALSLGRSLLGLQVGPSERSDMVTSLSGFDGVPVPRLSARAMERETTQCLLFWNSQFRQRYMC